ncbi:hypothetical protein JTB14_027365 [Gonioctena quinquepunctata]|nr:hypothetical protein JTB14_027365 [Gonioctena quinquepunctata]
MLKQHICGLNTAPEEILNQVIESGMLINLRRNCLGCTMISRKHPKTLLYFKSTRIEEMRHLTKYIHIIHPFSLFALYWEFFMFVVYMSSLMAIALGGVNVDPDIKKMWVYIKFLLNICIAVDMLKMFFTGFYDRNRDKTILKSSSIAEKYIRTYFFVDILIMLHGFTTFYTNLQPETH